jgi:uncharacterized protein
MTDDPTTSASTPAPSVVFDVVPALARELGLPPAGVAAVVALLAEGNTVPFIARYRKERTGGLDEVQLRAIEERRTYLTELEERRAVILASVAEQGKLTPALEAKLRAATAKAALEDLYAPYRPRRKTRASVARDKGLQPLADQLLAQPAEGDPLAFAATLVVAERGVATVEEALAGGRDIAAETIADTAEVRAYARRVFADHGELVTEKVPAKGDEPTKFEQYYAFREAVKTIPSHRFLAIRRGEAEGVLRAHVEIDTARVAAGIERLAKLDEASPYAGLLREAIADALKRLLAPSVENDLRTELKLRSDVAAVDVFADNLKNLLLTAPLGGSAVVGVDPGLRTGCKCAAIDATGKFLGTVTLFITQGEGQLAKARADLRAFLSAHPPRAIAVGNGTGGREAEAFVKQVLAELRAEQPDATLPFTVQVNEAGASVYSASDLAREEFPDLDLTIRGAISIARRLQDPLAELVKIEPKAIGVGQYQHDVHQPLLAKKLGDVVESAVNHVGVDLATASAQLLGYVAGIGKALAKKIVLHRDGHGAFATREALHQVAGLGPKAFEQCAGFLRIRGGAHPLDASAVHPERYALVERIAADLGVELAALIGHPEVVARVELATYVSDEVGEPTLRDILAELAKPGRDPRAEFAPPNFRDDVTSPEDLKVGMVLEGIVTNVTAFGAFVDIGVHNDGLVHVSQLAGKFVKDPGEVVKVGQKLKVRVLEVDLARKRIALSARPPGDHQRNDRGDHPQRQDRGDNRGDNRGQRPRGDRPQGQAPQAGGAGAAGPGERDNRGGRGRGGRPGERGPGAPAPQGPPPEGQAQVQGQAPRRDDNRGPRGGGGPGGGPGRRNDRGPQGPQGGQGPRPQRTDAPPGVRGPRPDGAPGDRGPRPDGAPGDRGPRPEGAPGDRGPRPDFRRDDRGPRRDDRGPRPDAPRRDDRGPRPDAPRRDDAPPPGYGVSGFVNNPFAKLTDLGGRKR